MAYTLPPQTTVQELHASIAVEDHLEWMRYMWQNSAEPLVVGRHTRQICSRIDKAIADYRRGVSSNIIIAVPFRHGKSDIVSRYLPPRFLGLFNEAEVLLASYGADLSCDFSKYARNLMNDGRYRLAFPNVNLANDSQAADGWGIADHNGKMQAVGLGGAMTGRGYVLGILDDYLKNREEAESESIRNKRWDSFTNDFLTRKAPVSITIILATPWHEDDIIGRIEKRMRTDKSFPRFELIRIPAFSNDYPTGTLFPERFSLDWYNGHKSVLGHYGTASLLQCNPITKGGNRFRVGNIRIVTASEVPSGLRWVRSWDLASSTKERQGDDPDWTAGALVAVQEEKSNVINETIKHVWVRDVVRLRAEATERNRVILATAERDGPNVEIAIEAVAGYKDAYTTLRDLLRGQRIVFKVTTTLDKGVRAAPLEPVIEAGNFSIVEGEWNRECVIEFARFPGGSHDDQVDAIATGYHYHTKKAVI